MKRLLLCVFFAFFCLYSQAQELPTVAPPSPETSSFMKFVEAPVNHHTGLPNINVPIHTVSYGGINIPISLDYHAKGVTVEEIASRVGIGWALNAGGAISRKQIGRADEDNLGLCEMSSLLKIAPTSVKARQSILDRELQANSTSYFLPDEFSYSFPGYSGKFVINYNTLEPELKKYDDIHVESVGSGCVTEGYKVTDKMGNVYHFGKVINGLIARTAHSSDFTVESGSVKAGVVTLSSNNSPNPAMQSPINTWHLLQVDTYTGRKIEFYYNSENVTFYRRSYDEAGTTVFSKIISTQMQLSEIHYGNNKVKFISASTNREDLLGGKALDKIEIINKSTLIKEYDLIQNYSNSEESTNVNSFYFDLALYAKKRLFLDKVIQKKGTVNLPGYEFTYSPIELPHRFSNSQDTWGYYNNASNGKYLVWEQGINSNYTRRVDVVYSEAGMLTDIKFPTGGNLSLDYEHNKVSKPEYYNDIITAPSNPQIEHIESFSKKDMVYKGNGRFEVNYYNTIGATGNNGRYYANCKKLADAPNPGCGFTFYIEEIGDPYGNPWFHSFSGGESGSLAFGGTLSPVVGYKLVATIIDSSINPFEKYENFRIDIVSYVDANLESQTYFGPGKRVKKTTFTESEGSIPLVKEYDYNFEDGTPSGKVFGIPLFQEKISSNGVVRIQHSSGGGSIYTSLFGTGIGYSKVVEYIGDLNNNIGKIEYEFTNTSDSGGKYWKFPYHSPIDNGWLRGRNLKTLTYGIDVQGSYVLKREVKKTYKYASELDLNIIKGGKTFEGIPVFPVPNLSPFIAFNFDQNTPNNYLYSKNSKHFKLPLIQLFPVSESSGTFTGEVNYKIYHYTGGTVDLTETSTTEHFDNGNSKTISTKYFYDYANHYQVAGTEMTNSQGALLKTENDYTILSDPNTFRILPRKTTTYKGNIKLSEQNTEYADFSGILLPQKVQTSKGTQSLEDRIVYHSYDDKGNPTEVSKKDGTHIVYVWGYNQTQPIAKIENATITELNSAISSLASNYNTLLEIQTISDNDTNRSIGESTSGEGLLRKSLNALRNASALSNAQVTTFTYDPLIGVTSITDPRGEAIYYEYDDFNRLKRVKDKDGNILSENEYNYKN